MNCIIVDDEPVARKGMKSLVEQIPQLTLVGSFNNAIAASAYINEYTVDLIFLDIQMPGITGIEFAQSIPVNTLIVFTTAYEIGIGGGNYKKTFFEEFVAKNLQKD